jgi:hypothetical protein
MYRFVACSRRTPGGNIDYFVSQACGESAHKLSTHDRLNTDGSAHQFWVERCYFSRTSAVQLDNDVAIKRMPFDQQTWPPSLLNVQGACRAYRQE